MAAGENVIPFSRLVIRDAGALQDKPVPKLEWLIDGVLTRRGITMLGGDGGTGKSLICTQLQVAAALGETWLGIPLPRDGMVTFGYYCEDDEDEIHRRLDRICKYYNVSFSQIDGRVLYMSRVGMNNELMTFNGRNDRGVVTKTFQQIEELIKLYRVELAIIDTVADAFLGNENIRPQVRAFVNTMRKLSLVNNGGTIITAHPSRAGLGDGSGLSGSTGWNGSVRARVYLMKPKAQSNEDGEEELTNERRLKTMKSNYGAAGGEIPLEWKDGIFERKGHVLGTFELLEVKGKLMAAAEELVRKGAPLPADPRASQSLVASAFKMPVCKGVRKSHLRAAQDALERAGELVIIELGPKSKRRKYVRPRALRYPGEDGGETERSIPPSAANPVETSPP